MKRNTVAVVTDGTAVLGLGDIGPEAALPVMEGKAILFKEFGGVDAWPICLATTDADEIVALREGDRAGASAASTSRTSRRRAASRSRRGCGTRSTSPSSTTISTGRRSSSWRRCSTRCASSASGSRTCSVVVTGVGAAGVATTRMLLAAGVGDVVGCDRRGALYAAGIGSRPVTSRSTPD